MVFDEEGEVVAEPVCEMTQRYPKPGWIEHDTNEILEAQLETI